MATDARTELNWFENAPVAGGVPEDNKFHCEGTSYYAGNAYTSAHINAVFAGAGASASNVALNQVVTAYSTAVAIAPAGKAAIIGGTGLAMTLAAPSAYAVCDINLYSISSGSLVITAAAGVTFDGTNNTATATVAGSKLTIGYLSATRWLIFSQNGFTFSLV